MSETRISKARLKDIARLKQKKYRLEEGKLVVEGLRALQQLQIYGVRPLEQYVSAGAETVWEDVPVFSLLDWEMGQICESGHPQGVAALFDLPAERRVDFNLAFYLEEISDPGNLGTIFRIAASFGIDTLLLSPDCAEVSSPKVVRASLGSVFQVPFATVGMSGLKATDARIISTSSASGIPLREFHPQPGEKLIIALGSEAHGLSPELVEIAGATLKIEMQSGMESLNVAVAAGIVAHHLYAGDSL